MWIHALSSMQYKSTHIFHSLPQPVSSGEKETQDTEKKSLNKVTNSINLTNPSLNVPGQQEEKEVGVSKSVMAVSLTFHKLCGPYRILIYSNTYNKTQAIPYYYTYCFSIKLKSQVFINLLFVRGKKTKRKSGFDFQKNKF